MEGNNGGSWEVIGEVIRMLYGSYMGSYKGGCIPWPVSSFKIRNRDFVMAGYKGGYDTLASIVLQNKESRFCHGRL